MLFCNFTGLWSAFFHQSYVILEIATLKVTCKAFEAGPRIVRKSSISFCMVKIMITPFWSWCCCLLVEQVILKIIKHCKDHSPSLVTGQLLGLDVGSVLEVTNCFPFPVRYHFFFLFILFLYFQIL